MDKVPTKYKLLETPPDVGGIAEGCVSGDDSTTVGPSVMDKHTHLSCLTQVLYVRYRKDNLRDYVHFSDNPELQSQHSSLCPMSTMR